MFSKRESESPKALLVPIQDETLPRPRGLLNARPSTYKPRNAQYDQLSQTRRQTTPGSTMAHSCQFPRQVPKNQNSSQPRTSIKTRQGGRCDRGTGKGSRVRNTERKTNNCGVQVLAESTCKNRESRGKMHSPVSTHRREPSRYKRQASTIEDLHHAFPFRKMKYSRPPTSPRWAGSPAW